MIKLDDNLLQELGLGALSPEDKKKMLAHIYETLEMRVGMELAKQMSDAQLNEFEGFINRNDEAGALRWLETNFPNYKDVVAAEFDKLKQEVKQVAPQIVASAQQQAQVSAGSPQQPPTPMMHAQPHQSSYAGVPPTSSPYPPQPSPPNHQQPFPTSGAGGQHAGYAYQQPAAAAPFSPAQPPVYPPVDPSHPVSPAPAASSSAQPFGPQQPNNQPAQGQSPQGGSAQAQTQQSDYDLAA